jgi:hypothetical protein
MQAGLRLHLVLPGRELKVASKIVFPKSFTAPRLSTCIFVTAAELTTSAELTASTEIPLTFSVTGTKLTSTSAKLTTGAKVPLVLNVTSAELAAFAHHSLVSFGWLLSPSLTKFVSRDTSGCSAQATGHPGRVATLLRWTRIGFLIARLLGWAIPTALIRWYI